MKSLQLRLSVGLFVSLISIFFLLWWMTSNSIRYLAEAHVISHMDHDAESILAAIKFTADNKISINSSQVEPVFQRPFSGQYYSVIMDNIVAHSPSLMGHVLSISAVPPGETRRIYQTGPKKQPLILFARSYNIQGKPLTIVLAEDLSSTLSKIITFQQRFTVISLICLLILVVIQVIILRSGFLPLKRIQGQISELETGKRNQLDSNAPQEVSALVCEVNKLLKVLDQRLQNSRNALGDLSHALKTPLTVLQQLSNEKALQSQPEICRSLKAQITNMQKITDHILKRARLAGEAAVASFFNIEPEMLDLATALKNIYREKNLTINLDIPIDGNLPIDREDMLELVGNLMDNACKWSNSTVRVTVFLTPTFRLLIEDDGPGVSEEFRSTLTTRGTRLDETVTGYGLGLSIVKCIVEQHNGSIEFGRSADLRGFCVEVNLPVRSIAQNSPHKNDKYT